MPHQVSQKDKRAFKNTYQEGGFAQIVPLNISGQSLNRRGYLFTAKKDVKPGPRSHTHIEIIALTFGLTQPGRGHTRKVTGICRYNPAA